jgi:serine---pyruvate transaminase
MKVSLSKIREEGLDNILAKQARNAQAARAGMLAMGMEIFPSPPNNALTVGKMPAGVDSSVVLGKLEKQYGMKLANGQDHLKGKIIRLAHMGYIDQFDVLAALSGLELVLLEMGQPIEPGTAVAAAQKVWAQVK